MNRRHFLLGGLTVAGVSLLAGCGIPFGLATPSARLRRIGFLAGGGLTTNDNLGAFQQGMLELGYVNGRTYALELRYADGREERLPELAADLAANNVDVIITGSTVAIRAAARATTTIPIVFAATGSDLVADGVVASLARPGGNITGLTTTAGDESVKRLELLKEAVPGLSRAAVLWNQSVVGNFRETAVAARVLGVEAISLELRSSDEIESVLAGAITARVEGLMVLGGPVFGVLAPRIVELAVQYRLPAVYSNPPYIDVGGLMIYAVNISENYRRAATYVDKILKGAKAGDLPIERPARYDFIVNLKTAQALGLNIPQSVLAQATEVFQ